jgi:hypothetical protein
MVARLCRFLAASRRRNSALDSSNLLSRCTERGISKHIWRNDRTGQPVKRSLVAYDH